MTTWEISKFARKADKTPFLSYITMSSGVINRSALSHWDLVPQSENIALKTTAILPSFTKEHLAKIEAGGFGDMDVIYNMIKFK